MNDMNETSATQRGALRAAANAFVASSVVSDSRIKRFTRRSGQQT